MIKNIEMLKVFVKFFHTQHTELWKKNFRIHRG